ncbi:glycosyltransferase family 4 protein [Pseudomonas sp. CMR5c]|uniref:glycosyltransferase family 4 protein n=1 Tax=Pseudomonas sp. CMR5c TaxID=658630 RepID=UPI00069D0ADB|nr:glycosyltransferase [Pseudomonas sp. CMR5c]AZC20639.1 Glycosyl transferase, group 1 [Pseudomonas sp. CMR5c]
MGPVSRKKVRILTFVSYYLPGYKAGGPLRTLANMAENLGDSFEFWIVTRDRDQGESQAFDSVCINQWQEIANAHVYYISPERCGIQNIAEIISSTDHDLIYLNSFFDPTFTLKPLLALKFLLASYKPIILAPRGEFSEGALIIKPFKKKLYIKLISRFYKGVKFQVSSNYEKSDTLRTLPWLQEKDTYIAIDLAEKPTATLPMSTTRTFSTEQSIRLIFLSRICKMKNLDYALSVLSKVTSQICLDIYGPQEEPDYWSECEVLIRDLPANIQVNYCGNVMPEHVKPTFAAYDLFFFPTKGENYGHVIAESISVGTPVLLSDQTPWRDLENEGLGWDYPLDDPLQFARAIERFASIPVEERKLRRDLVYKKAVEKLSDQSAIESNKQLFLSVLKNGKP